MPVILIDMGGTHTRFGLWDQGKLLTPHIYKTSDIQTMVQGVSAYQNQYNLENIKILSFCTAANLFADGVWRFSNQSDQLSFSVADITKAGYQVLCAEDDFVATAHGCLNTSFAVKDILIKEKQESSDPCVVLGAGTGLGLAYGIKQKDKYLIQKTYGGHMLFTPISDWHMLLSRQISKIKKLDRPVIFEDFIGGVHFPFLYQACCDLLSLQPEQDIFANTSHPALKKALEVFHEMLGLFVHLSVVTTHGFGGVYLNGGFLKFLMDRKLWNQELFIHSFHQTGVPILTESVQNTPIYCVHDTHISLYGLGYITDAYCISNY